jgi:hypothetical protein
MKLAPLNQSSEELRLESESLEGACRFATELQRRRLSVWEAVVTRPMFRDDQSGPPVRIHILTVELKGTVAGVERSLVEIERMTQDMRTRPVTPNLSVRTSSMTGFRRGLQKVSSCEMSVLPSRVPELEATLDDAAPGAWIRVRQFAVPSPRHCAHATTKRSSKLCGRRRRRSVARSPSLTVLRPQATHRRLRRSTACVRPHAPRKAAIRPERYTRPGRFVGRL